MTPEIIGSLLHQCSKIKALHRGLCLHAAAVRSGLESNVIVSNHILNMYAKCGNMSLARKVFDEMPERNLVSWSAMISGYGQLGQHHQALDLFSKMDLIPNEYIYASAISACSNLKALLPGQQIHAHSLKYGYESVSFACNSLVSMYMKCGYPADALSVFNHMPDPNLVSFNAVLSGFEEHKQADEGFKVFQLMTQRGILPDRFTFTSLFEICINARDMRRGKALHGQGVKLTLDRTPFVGNVILTMYSELNLLEQAEKVFRLIEGKDVISWNTLIAASCHCMDHEKSLIVFQNMLNDTNLRPDDFTFSSVLTACSGIASIRHGKQIHCQLIRKGSNIHDLAVSNALVNMYAKCGSIDCAHHVFSSMVSRNIVSWNTMIAGLGNHGLGVKALGLFSQMKGKGVKPDSVTFVGLLVACNHAGLVETGMNIFNCMEESYGVAPDVEHLSCVIDLLGRAGRLREAEAYMNTYSFGNDPIVLGSLLSACRLQGDVVIGERLAKKILELGPASSSPFVLLSNMYASDEMWNHVADARRMLKGSRVKKEAGHSLVEVDGRFEKFTIGDFSHPRVEDVQNILGVVSSEVCEVSVNYVDC